MFTLITTWATEKIIAVLTVSLVAVAAVPTALILTTEHQTAVVIQQQDSQQRTVLITTVKNAGDSLILKLQGAEASCNAQVAGLVTSKNVDPAKIQLQLTQLKTQLHTAIVPIVNTIKQQEASFANLVVITPELEVDELAQLKQIEVLAFGDGKTIGVVTVSCQSVVLAIQQVILVVTLRPETEARDCHVEIEQHDGQFQFQSHC